MTAVIGTRARSARVTGLTVGVAVVCLAAFVTLFVLVARAWPPLVTFDRGVDDGVHSGLIAASNTEDNVSAFQAVSDAFDPDHISIVAGVLAVLLLVARRVRAAIYVAVARFGELLVESLTKNVVARARPDLPHPFTSSDSFSFPSGHTGGTTVLFVALLVLLAPVLRARAARLIAVAVVVLVVLAVATSRILLGAHFPSDVLGGALLGTAFATGASLLLPARRSVPSSEVASSGAALSDTGPSGKVGPGDDHEAVEEPDDRGSARGTELGR